MDANLVWHTEGRLSVVVHGRLGPTTLEWDRYLNHIRDNVPIKNLRVLGLTLGGSPDGQQRQAMAEVVRQQYSQPPRVAILTGSLIVRGVMKLSGIFNPHIRCFAPEEFALACAYLGLDALERDQGARQLATLQKKVV